MAKQVLNYHDVQLYESDFALFRNRQWFNDNAINFYFQYPTQTHTSKSVLLMDPAVVSCLLHQCEDEDEYRELAKGLDLAYRHLYIIPVTDNETLDGNSSHWSLLLYCDGSFRHFDSSCGHNNWATSLL
ncbi:hypothetical protein PsorP6_010282 [Peronosclerospora sorghi]|uniref:Uncharacterized protein n=1 Tax=Peronosclerospora sorghi TaxID=230839 RepID=A0ACC0VVL8_9STRA|nr:hypothetical protein PsorP6_010282 [Peronosclerospora sorghi]